jgi:hypothetical protein
MFFSLKIIFQKKSWKIIWILWIFYRSWKFLIAMRTSIQAVALRQNGYGVYFYLRTLGWRWL